LPAFGSADFLQVTSRVPIHWGVTPLHLAVEARCRAPLPSGYSQPVVFVRVGPAEPIERYLSPRGADEYWRAFYNARARWSRRPRGM
jgi:hypothetical protein